MCIRDRRNYLLGVLQAEFKEVFVAGDGEEAWEILGQCQPDIVISDVMMPRTDGFELCYRIKNDVAVSHIPVVLLTARVDQASSVEGDKSGADIYLAKPFDIDSLLVILRNILRPVSYTHLKRLFQYLAPILIDILREAMG